MFGFFSIFLLILSTITNVSFITQAETIKLMDRYLKEGGYIKAIYKELTKSDNSEWVAVGVKSVLQFAFQIFLTLLNGYIIDNG